MPRSSKISSVQVFPTKIFYATFISTMRATYTAHGGLCACVREHFPSSVSRLSVNTREHEYSLQFMYSNFDIFEARIVCCSFAEETLCSVCMISTSRAESKFQLKVLAHSYSIQESISNVTSFDCCRHVLWDSLPQHLNISVVCSFLHPLESFVILASISYRYLESKLLQMA